MLLKTSRHLSFLCMIRIQTCQALSIIVFGWEGESHEDGSLSRSVKRYGYMGVNVLYNFHDRTRSKVYSAKVGERLWTISKIK